MVHHMFSFRGVIVHMQYTCTCGSYYTINVYMIRFEVFLSANMDRPGMLFQARGDEFVHF